MDLEYLDKYEQAVGQAIRTYLLSHGAVDGMMPDAPDIEDKWQSIAESYLPDGVREFNGYPMVSLGWMMFIGMAIAKLWDEDWETYSAKPDLYASIRDVRGYDCMDEYICEEILKVGEEMQAVSKLVGDTAQIAHRALMREGFEPGTPMAFHAYARTLHQLYIYGYAVQLKRMGYHMTKM